VVAVGSYSPKERPSVRYYGTGFSIFDGTLVVTNQHVIDALARTGHLEDLRLYLPDTTSIEGLDARVVASDAHHDVALLQVDKPILPPLQLEIARTPRQGETIGILGYPIGMALGVTPAAHKGVISAVVPAVLPLPRGVKLTPELAEAIRRPYHLYQLDMVVYPGNSGSPLLDGQTGRVLGIINKTLATKTREHLLDSPSGISYAVPVKWIHELVARTVISMDTKSDDK
jgi:S1-C subfamily serine protease